MNFTTLEELIKNNINNNDLACASIAIIKDGEEIYKNKWGYSNIEEKKEVEYDSIFKLMSMSKIITAIAIMKLIEDGKIGLDEDIGNFISEFKNPKVIDDKRYVLNPNMNPLKILWRLISFNPKNVKTKPAKRAITPRDLLSHSSGLEQGVYGFIRMLRNKKEKTTLEDQAKIYATYPLDFEPGEGTGYSPIAGFDMLGYLISKVSGVSFDEYIQRNICEPLNMKHTFFYARNDKEKEKIVRAYKTTKKHKLIDVTGVKKDDMDSLLKRGNEGYCSGSGGLFSTLEDYLNIAKMFTNNGVFEGKQILKKETIDLMRKEAPSMHLEPEPGYVWGLGVKIRQNKEKGKFSVSEGTYGWSGAFGTHFFISPKENIGVVFMTNITNSGGSGYPLLYKIEEAIFKDLGE